MPTLAGWLTGQQVSEEIIAHTLSTMGDILARHGGEKFQNITPGAGLISFADSAYTTTYEPAVLDWSPERRTFTYHRPLSGFHPLYYILDWPDKGNLLFASEIKALFAAGVPRKWHLAALDTLLQIGFIPAPWTAFKDIQVVPAGSTLRWQYTQTLLNQIDYHTLDISGEAGDNEHELQHMLLQAVQQQLPPQDQRDALAVLSAGDIPSLLPIILAAKTSIGQFTVTMISHRKSSKAHVWRNAESIAGTYDKPFLAITAVSEPDYWIPTLIETESPAIDMRPCITHQLLHTLAQETGARVALSGLGAHAITATSFNRFFTTTSDMDKKHSDPLGDYQSMLGAGLESTSSPWSHDVRQTLSQQESWSQTHHARRLHRRASQFSTAQQSLHFLDLHLRLPDKLVSPFQQIAIQERMALRSPYLHPRVAPLLLRATGRPHTLEQVDTLWSSLLQNLFPYPLHPLIAAPLTLPPAQSMLSSAQSALLQQLLSLEFTHSSGIFDPQFVQTLRDGRQTEATNRLLPFVLTTHLLSQLFKVSL